MKVCSLTVPTIDGRKLIASRDTPLRDAIRDAISPPKLFRVPRVPPPIGGDGTRKTWANFDHHHQPPEEPRP